MNAKETTAAVMEPIRTGEREVLLPLQRKPAVEPEPGLVVFLCQSITSRVLKLGRAAKIAGFRPVLVLVGGAWTGHAEQRGEFEQTHLVGNASELFEVLGRYEPVVYHPVLQTMNAGIALVAPFLFSPDRVVVDFYDPVDPSVNPQRFDPARASAQSIIAAHRFQRFGYDNARGICTRLMLPKLTRTRLPQHAQHRIFYPEPVWVKARPNVPRLSAQDGKLRVAFIGNFEPLPAPEPDFAGFMWLAERCEALNIHFHLHSSSNRSAANFARYQRLADLSPNFHIGPYVGIDRLTHMLAAYDVGITPTMPESVQSLWSSNRALYPRGNWGGKIAEYVDARLFTLVSTKHWSMARMVLRYGLGAAPTTAQLLDQAFWQTLPQRVERARGQIERVHPTLTIEAQAPRLGALYRAVDTLARSQAGKDPRARRIRLTPSTEPERPQ